MGDRKMPKAKNNRNSGKKPYARPDANSSSGSRRTSAPGQHGYKEHEQKRLTAAHGITVSGETHESEHPIGVAPLIKGSGAGRDEGQQNKDIEFYAPASQEMKAFHRAHAGTGRMGKEARKQASIPDTD